MIRNTFTIDPIVFQAIWNAHHLGQVLTVELGGKGWNNPNFVVNQRWVLRFDNIINEGVSRFWGEQRAYTALRAIGVPVPEVLAVDDSRTLAPYDYLIMSKIEGSPLVESWSSLLPAQREQAAYEAGRCLARMHSITFNTFGKLFGTEHIFETWYPYIHECFAWYSQEAIVQGKMQPAVWERLQSVLTRYRPIFDRITSPSLVHWDYHFRNIMQQDGVITGILDFEWALAGDPAHDFYRCDEWEEDCPGSYAPMIAGYTSLRPLQDDHDLRVKLYHLVWRLDTLVDAEDAAETALMHTKLLASLERLE